MTALEEEETGLPIHVYDHVENVLKHFFFYVDDVKAMA
jgi:hypothetical protein